MTTTTADTAPVSQPFQAEAAELPYLMVHSVYSEIDIFLRELISNACDKLRREAIAKPSLIAIGSSKMPARCDVTRRLDCKGLLGRDRFSVRVAD